MGSTKMASVQRRQYAFFRKPCWSGRFPLQLGPDGSLARHAPPTKRSDKEQGDESIGFGDVARPVGAHAGALPRNLDRIARNPTSRFSSKEKRGTGKDLGGRVRSIRASPARRNGRTIVLDCGGSAGRPWVESRAFFGHERGAFHGGGRGRGRVSSKQADGRHALSRTEIGESRKDLQAGSSCVCSKSASLGGFGGAKTISVDVRVNLGPPNPQQPWPKWKPEAFRPGTLLSHRRGARDGFPTAARSDDDLPLLGPGHFLGERAFRPAFDERGFGPPSGNLFSEPTVAGQNVRRAPQRGPGGSFVNGPERAAPRELPHGSGGGGLGVGQPSGRKSSAQGSRAAGRPATPSSVPTWRPSSKKDGGQCHSGAAAICRGLRVRWFRKLMRKHGLGEGR